MRWTNLPLHLLVSAVLLGAAEPALAADDAPMPHRKHREGPDLDLGDDAAAPPAAADEALPSRSKHAKKHSKWWLKHHPKEAAEAGETPAAERHKRLKKHSKWWLKHHPKEAAAERAAASGTAPPEDAAPPADKPTKMHSKWWLKHHPKEAAALAAAAAHVQEASSAPAAAPVGLGDAPPERPLKKHSKWWLKHHPKEAAAERAVGSGWQQEQGRGPGEPPKTPLVLALSRHLHVGTWDLAVLATAAEISTRFAALVRVANGADGGNPVCHLMVLSGNEDQPKTVEQDVRLHACPRGDEGADQTLLQPQPLGSVGAWLVRVIAGRYERKGRGVEMQQQWTMVAEMADGARVVFEHVATSFKGAADESFDQSETCTAPTVQFGQRGEPASARIGCDQLVRRDSYVRPSHHVYEYAWIDGQFVSR